MNYVLDTMLWLHLSQGWRGSRLINMIEEQE